MYRAKVKLNSNLGISNKLLKLLNFFMKEKNVYYSNHTNFANILVRSHKKEYYIYTLVEITERFLKRSMLSNGLIRIVLYDMIFRYDMLLPCNRMKSSLTIMGTYCNGQIIICLYHKIICVYTCNTHLNIYT